MFSIFKTKNKEDYSSLPSALQDSKPEKTLNNKKKLLNKIETTQDVSQKSKTSTSTARSSQSIKKNSPIINKKATISDYFGSELSSLSSSEEDPRIEECKFTEKKVNKPVKQNGVSITSKAKETTSSKLEKQNIQTLEDFRMCKQRQTAKMDVSKALEFVNKLKTDKKSENVETVLKEKKLIPNSENIKAVNRVLEYTAKIKAEQKSKELEEEQEKQKMRESNKENVNKIMAYLSKVNSEKSKKENQSESIKKEIVTESENESTQSVEESNQNFSPKRKETNEDEESDNESNSSKKKCKPKREYEYEVIDENSEIESQIEIINSINKLTEAQIEYMVLRDINYYIDIFSGNCDHSWRHLEYKKYSKKSGNLLYSNSSLSNFRTEQYTAAVKALQSIFCRKNNKFDEYIIKVLLPEALIKISMRIYQCSKEAAEEFLQHNNFKNDFKETPKGSAIKSSVK